MLNESFEIKDVTNLSIALTGLILAFVSMTFSFAVFIRNQKNYYQNFLKFLTKKERKIKRRFSHRKINSPLYAEFLMSDLQFFGEHFFVNFSSDGNLNYYQFKTIKGIYRHLRKRLIISARVFRRALRKQKDSEIIVRLQLFNKYNYINKNYYQNKLKNAKMTKNNPNVYVTIKLVYDPEKRSFINESDKKPSSIFEMGSDFDFKKNMYYIFSRANKIETKLDEEQIDRQYFFVSCSVIPRHRGKKAASVSDEELAEIGNLEEKR